MTVNPETIASLEAAVDESNGFPYAGSRLAEAVTDETRDEFAPFVIALGYHFIEHGAEELRARAEGAFGAAMEFDNKRFPPMVASLPPETLSRWVEVTEVTENSALLARLHDLLWVARQGDRPDLHARAASDAYVEVAERTNWHAMDRVDCLSRALELARSVGDDDRIAAAESAMLQLADASLESGGDSDLKGPGISLTLLQALRDLGNLDDEGLDGRLIRASEHFSGDPHTRDNIADLREPQLNQEQRTALRKAQIQDWRQVAENETGLTRVLHLEHALEIARVHQLSSEERELLRELQEIPEDDLDLKEISAEVEIPTEKMEAFVEAFIDPKGLWQVSLMRFGNYGPPGGTDQEVNDQVTDLMQKAPIQFHVTKVVYGPAGNSIFKAVDDESHRHLAAAERRAFAARLWSLSAVRVLEMIRDRHGRPSESELADFFATELIPADLASRIARSFDLYWDGHFDEAGHMLAPRLERVIRELARRVGIPIIKPPHGLHPGGVRTLGDLLSALKGAFAEDAWRAYLRNLLADPLGLNLRNAVAHDLHHELESADVALLLHAACFLRLLGARPVGSEHDE